MNGVELNEALPEAYLERAGRLGIHDRELRGKTRPPLYGRREELQRETKRVVDYIKKVVFPKVSAGHSG
jgi:hypothetical protein